MIQATKRYVITNFINPKSLHSGRTKRKKNKLGQIRHSHSLFLILATPPHLQIIPNDKQINLNSNIVSYFEGTAVE